MKMFGTEDFNEGLTAFIEKRAPQWKGRWTRGADQRRPSDAGRPGSGDGLDDAVVVEELGQPVDEAQSATSPSGTQPASAASSPASARLRSTTITSKSRITKWWSSSRISAQPISAPQTTLEAGLLGTSRTTASAASRPARPARRARTTPPAAGPWPRRTISRSYRRDGDGTDAHLGRTSAGQATSACHSVDRRRAMRVHDDRPSDQPEAPRRSSWCPGRRAGRARRSPMQRAASRQSTIAVHHSLAHPDAPGVGLDVEVVDHGERPSASDSIRPADSRRGSPISADQDRPSGRSRSVCSGPLRSARSGIAARNTDAALQRGESFPCEAGESDELAQVVDGGDAGAGRVLGHDVGRHDWSWEIRSGWSGGSGWPAS